MTAKSALLAVAVATLAACGSPAVPSPATVSGAGDPDIVVVATTSILGDVTATLLEGVTEIEVLMPPGADPHSFQLSAGQAARLANADAVIANGLGLEEGMERVIDGLAGTDTLVVSAGEHVDPLIYDPGAGDSVGSFDPHFWTDPSRMSRAVEAIAVALGERLGADQKALLDANTSRYLAELEDLDADVWDQVEEVPPERRVLVTDHHVFGYFAQRYGFDILGAIVPSGSTLASPSAADLADLADVIRAAGVPALFVDTAQPDRLAQALAQESDVEVEIVSLYGETLSEPEGEAGTYLDMVRTNTRRIVESLRPPRETSG